MGRWKGGEATHPVSDMVMVISVDYLRVCGIVIMKVKGFEESVQGKVGCK